MRAIRLALRLATIALALLCATWAAPLRAGYLRASGVQTLNINNQPLLLRGVDLGSWLWPEYYMMGSITLPAYANAGTGSGNINNYYDGLLAAITDVLGGNTNLAAQVMDAYWTNFISQGDIAYLHGIGINSVRVPYDFEEFFQVTNWANNYPTNGFDVTNGFKYLDNLVSWCSNNSIYVILDMHCAPGGPNNFGVVNYGGTPNTNTASVFINPANLALAEHIWTRIASRYVSNEWIGGYDLLNEPVNTSTGSLQVGEPYLSTTYSNLIRTIRAVDTNHLLFCEGDVYATQFWDVNQGWSDSDWSFSDHDYGSPLPLGTGNRSTAAGDNVPDWAGEWGINSTHWYNRILDTTYVDPVSLSDDGSNVNFLEGYCFWAYKACGEFYCIAQNPMTPGWNTLAAYWASSNTLAKPTVANAYTWLMQFALAANFSNCLTHPEIVDSLTRAGTNGNGTGFSQATLPYKSGVTIPGRIFAVDYDMGDTNVAYADTVSDDEASRGPSGTAWNSGYFGRDDGVDETTCDDPGTLLKVGWNNAGEWQRHTVTCTPATYNLYVRAAGGATGGQLNVMINSNVVSGTITVPYTGAYTTYTNCIVSNIVVTNSGTVTVQVNVLGVGYDLAWIEFVSANGPPLPPTGETVMGAAAEFNPGLTLGLQAAPGNTTTALSWVASDGATSYNVQRAANSGGPYSPVASTTSLSYLDTGLANGTTYYYVVSAVNNNGQGANSTQVASTPQSTTLPSPWTDADVGIVTLWDGDAGEVGWPGGASYAGNVYAVVGSGTDIWGSSDSCHYAFRAATGNFTITSEVTSLQNTDPWAKAGVMIRESLNQDALNATMLITSQNGSLFSYRTGTGYTSSSSGGSGAAPYWVRLVRSGNNFTGSVSANGSSFTQVGSIIIPMATNVMVGLDVTAHNNLMTNSSTFANVSVSLVLPSAPTGLNATANAAEASLTWNASAGAADYNILRAATNIGPYTNIATVVAVTNYTDTAVVNGTTYYYEVSAVNANGTSGPSSSAGASIPLPALTGLYLASDNRVKLLWPQSASPFTLFSTLSLNAPVQWTPVTNAVVNQDGVSYVDVRVSSSNSAQFFRLAAP